MKTQIKLVLIIVLSSFVLASGAIPLGAAGLAKAQPAQKLTWVRLTYPVLPPPRAGFALALDPVRQEIVLFGGQTEEPIALNDLWAFDGLAWSELPPFGGLRPLARVQSGLVYDQANQNFLLFGGYQDYEFLGSTWTYRPSNWVQHFAQPAPSPRAGASIVYDPIRQVTILFGGYYFEGLNIHLLNDLWTWDGANWQQQFPLILPPARYNASLVYDPRSQNFILYGGASVAAMFSDTWVWDGTNWQEQHPAHNPGGRSNFGMTFDENRQQVLLFGGQTMWNARPGDTWTWDGSDWTRLATAANPPADLANGARLVYLPSLQTTALVGLYSPKICAGDVCTSQQEMQVWVLDERFLSYMPILAP